MQLTIRCAIACVLSLALAYHGRSKNSLSVSGAIAAVIVGFCSFACSYRFGLILILFYYTSSKLTKVKEDVKAKLEDEYSVGGQRNWIQVFANSILATGVAVCYFLYCGEDSSIQFGHTADEILVSLGPLVIAKSKMTAQLAAAYVGHYACSAADTWASELGILAKRPPRLVTTLFLRTVPPGTNGGMSVLGTLASAAGGMFIGCVYCLLDPALFTAQPGATQSHQQYPMIFVGLICGVLGSLYDSLLGATLQATYYCHAKKKILKHLPPHGANSSSIEHICGVNILSNEAVNFISILMTMVTACLLAPSIFCYFDRQQC